MSAPQNLERVVAPGKLSDLVKHRVAVSVNLMSREDWSFFLKDRTRYVPVVPSLTGHTVVTAIVSALSGWAITRVLSHQVSDALSDGRSVEWLAGFEDRKTPVHLVHAQGALRASKIGAFMEQVSMPLRSEEMVWTSRRRHRRRMKLVSVCLEQHCHVPSTVEEVEQAIR